MYGHTYISRLTKPPSALNHRAWVIRTLASGSEFSDIPRRTVAWATEAHRELTIRLDLPSANMDHSLARRHVGHRPATRLSLRMPKR